MEKNKLHGKDWSKQKPTGENAFEIRPKEWVVLQKAESGQKLDFAVRDNDMRGHHWADIPSFLMGVQLQ